MISGARTPWAPARPGGKERRVSRPGRGVGTACLATPSSSLKAADRRQHWPSHPAPASPEALWAQRSPYPVLPQFFPGCDVHLDLCSAPVSWVQFSSPSHLAHRVGLGLGQGQVPARGKGKALHFSWRVRLGLEPGRCQAREASCSPENWGWGGRCRGACRNLGSQEAACCDFRSMALCTRGQEQRKAPAWCPSCRRKKLGTETRAATLSHVGVLHLQAAHRPHPWPQAPG